MPETTKNYDDRVGYLIRNLRIDLDATLDNVAEALATRFNLALSSQTVAKVERGVRPLKANELEPFAETLGTTAIEFLEMLPSEVPVLERPSDVKAENPLLAA